MAKVMEIMAALFCIPPNTSLSPRVSGYTLISLPEPLFIPFLIFVNSKTKKEWRVSEAIAT